MIQYFTKNNFIKIELYRLSFFYNNILSVLEQHRTGAIKEKQTKQNRTK